MYLKKGMSVKEISEKLGYSERGINYWMDKNGISRRTRSEAMYLKYNPNGNPFKIKKPKSLEESKLLGLGLGLYWGEGTKSSRHSVRLGNTDPELIRNFIEFLEIICGVNRSKLSFGLQIFSDIDPIGAEEFWIEKLKINPNQLYKTIITKPRGKGTYRNKTRYGVLTIYFNNIKLREYIEKEIDKLKLS